MIPGFYDPAACWKLRQEMLDVVECHPEAVHISSSGADRRIFGAERAAEGISAFAEEPRVLNAARTVLGGDAENAFTLAGIIAYRQGNLGSGEGWHRDSFFNQFKAIVYLTDVTESNGPFEYITHSHVAQRKFSDYRRYGIPLRTTRIEDASASKLIAAEPGRHRIFTASMGTLILVDTTGMHRGMPLVGGERFALTNYYFPGKSLRPKLFDHFAPVLGRHVPVSECD
ncbi:MAG: phytanoyl-CoA dioxygenase family protein [Actinomycetia bacterium]|nr:phytanoyl-CoA dioxygenase family protein [Actinomycetes bacterium]